MMRRMADVLVAQEADGFRIAAYRRAARSIETLDRRVIEIAREDGLEGLVALPDIGRGIGSAIMEIVETGRWSQLDRLTGALEPEALFQTLPGIGAGLAARIHDELGIDTLEQLEQVAHDGRLETVKGVGEQRVALIKALLSQRLGRRRWRSGDGAATPAIAVLLDVDREYREKASQGTLRKIAPRRFNPSGKAWLPVLHTQRGDWLFTVLYSNTERAHRLGKSDDWVVIYYHTGHEPEQQCTVVTETRGALALQRVVRGREGETIAHYARNTS